MTRPAGRLGLATIAALWLLMGHVSGAFAHAELVASDPADSAILEDAPTTVRLTFSEPIEPDFFGLEVYASDRTRIDQGNPRISANDVRVLEVDVRPGGSDTYTVVWRALSLDSHVVQGVFAYTVGAGASPGAPLDLTLPGSGAPFPVESAARWLTFLAAFVLLGGFAFRPLILDRAAEIAGVSAESADHVLATWRNVAWAATGLLLVVSFASLVFQASSAAGVPLNEVMSGRALTRLLTATKYGTLWFARTGLIVVLFGVMAWLAVESGSRNRIAWWTGAAVSAALLLTLSASGHASGVQNLTALAVGADWLHMVAGGLWVGGLVQLALTLPRLLRSADGEPRARQTLGQMVPRFSWLAGLSVAVLIVTGSYAVWIHVPGQSAVLDTAYGAALSGKLLLFVPMLLLAAVNLLVMHPRFKRQATAAAGRSDSANRSLFRWIVLAEVGFALLVLAATGVLAGLPPASSLVMEGRPYTEARKTSSYSVTLGVRPNQAGENLLAVAVDDARGQHVTGTDSVRLTLTMLEMQMGTREVQLQQVEPGRFEARGNYLSMPGNWEGDVTVRRNSTDEVARFSWLVGQAPGANRPAFSPGRIVLLAANTQSLLALVALGCAAVLFFRRDSLRRRDRRPLEIAATAMLIGGLAVGSFSVAEAYRQSQPNPVRADAASLQRGLEVYQTAGCASCHGDEGRGDGVAGLRLVPRPADFRTHMAAGHTDRELFDWISNGVAGTAMPGFASQLSEQERWDVINYIRSFADPTLAPTDGR